MSVQHNSENIYESELMTPVNNSKSLKCPIHGSEELVKYCITCKTAVCKICILTGPHNTSVV